MSEFKSDEYYRDLGKGNPAPPELVERLSRVGDGATIDTVVSTALILGRFMGKTAGEQSEMIASMLLEIGFSRGL